MTTPGQSGGWHQGGVSIKAWAPWLHNKQPKWPLVKFLRSMEACRLDYRRRGMSLNPVPFQLWSFKASSYSVLFVMRQTSSVVMVSLTQWDTAMRRFNANLAWRLTTPTSQLWSRLRRARGHEKRVSPSMWFAAGVRQACVRVCHSWLDHFPQLKKKKRQSGHYLTGVCVSKLIRIISFTLRVSAIHKNSEVPMQLLCRTRYGPFL